MRTDYLTVAEAAARLNCSGVMVRKALRRGTLSGERDGYRWLVDEASIRVYQDQHQAGGPRVCSRCGRSFQATIGHQRYCSIQCQDQYVSPVPPGGYDLDCAHCGAAFRTGTTRQRFCSTPCRVAAHFERHGRRAADFHEGWRVGRKPLIRVCQECGERFECWGAHRRYCGPSCGARAAGKVQLARMKGAVD